MSLRSHILHLPKLAYLEEHLKGRQVLLTGDDPGPVLTQLSVWCQRIFWVDSSPIRVRYLQHRYAFSNVIHIITPNGDIGLPDHSLDVAIALSTPNDRHWRSQFIAESARLLSADGFLLMSSRLQRPFSHLEPTPRPASFYDALLQELQSHFPEVTPLWQQSGLASLVGPTRGILPTFQLHLTEPQPLDLEALFLASSLPIVFEDTLLATYALEPVRLLEQLQRVRRIEKLDALLEPFREALEFPPMLEPAQPSWDLSSHEELPPPSLPLPILDFAAEPSTSAGEHFRIIPLTIEAIGLAVASPVDPELPSLHARIGELELQLEQTSMMLQQRELELEDLRLERDELEGALRVSELLRESLLQPSDEMPRANHDPVGEAPKGVGGAESGAASTAEVTGESLDDTSLTGELVLKRHYEELLTRERLKIWMLEDQVRALRTQSDASTLFSPGTTDATVVVVQPAIAQNAKVGGEKGGIKEGSIHLVGEPNAPDSLPEPEGLQLTSDDPMTEYLPEPATEADLEADDLASSHADAEETLEADGLDTVKPQETLVSGARLRAAMVSLMDALERPTSVVEADAASSDGQALETTTENASRSEFRIPLPAPATVYGFLEGWDTRDVLGGILEDPPPADEPPVGKTRSLSSDQAVRSSSDADTIIKVVRDEPGASELARASSSTVNEAGQAHDEARHFSESDAVDLNEMPQAGEMALLEALHPNNLERLPTVTHQVEDEVEQALFEAPLEESVRRRFHQLWQRTAESPANVVGEAAQSAVLGSEPVMPVVVEVASENDSDGDIPTVIRPPPTDYATTELTSAPTRDRMSLRDSQAAAPRSDTAATSLVQRMLARFRRGA